MSDWPEWAHVMFSARGHWLPGDARGFRDRDHRIHSSGNYKDPPPPDEHAGLRRYAQAIAAPAVRIPEHLRATIAEVLGAKFDEMGTPARIIAVTETHAHALVRGRTGRRQAARRACEAGIVARGARVASGMHLGQVVPCRPRAR